MFRLKNKSFSAWSFVAFFQLVFVLIFSFSSSSFAAPKTRSFDTEDVSHLLSSRAEVVSDYQSQKYAQNPQVPTDLFVRNMENYQTQRRSVILQGLEGTKELLQQQYASCVLSSEELGALLFFINKEFAKELRAHLPEKKYPTRDDYKASCKKLTTCIEGEKTENLNIDCEHVVHDAYRFTASVQENKLLIEESNLWEDKYQNGNTKDASYDLLDDLSVIGKLLFQDTQEAPELIFYRTPQFSTRAQDPTRSKKSSGSGALFSPSFSAQSSSVPSGGSGRWVAQTRGIGQRSWVSSEEENSPATLLLSEDRAINAFIKAHEPQATKAQKGGVAFVTPCLAPWQSLDSSESNPASSQSAFSLSSPQQASSSSSSSSSSPQQQQPLALSPQQLNGYIREALQATQLLHATVNPSFPSEEHHPLERVVTTDSVILDDVKQQLQSCLSRCTSLPWDEQISCQIQCLCVEYSSKNLPEKTKFHLLDEGSLGFKLCTIPSKISLPKTHGKNLLSIESILREIWQVIDGLYESGELTSKRNNKEFLNTTQADYTFDQDVSFVAGISTKSFRTSTNLQAQQKFEADRNQQRKEATWWTEDERNRYVLLDNYDSAKYRRWPTRSDASLPQNVDSPLDQTTVQNLQKWAQVNALVATFLEKQRKLLIELNTTLLDIEEILLSLEQKK